MNFRELRRTLRSKLGASEDKEGEHIYYWYPLDSRDRRVGKVSHTARGSQQVDDFIILDTARRLKLNKKEFLQFADCSIDRDGLSKLWQERTP